MTNPTDPRIEAAARALRIEQCLSVQRSHTYARIALKAAYQVAWQPIGGVVNCQLAALVEQGSDEGPHIGSCRNGVWCDGLDMVEPTHYMPLPAPPEATP